MELQLRLGASFPSDFIKVKGVFQQIISNTELKKHEQKLKTALNNFSQIEFKDLWASNVEEMFRKEGAVGGWHAWTPLNPQWLKRKLGITKSRKLRYAQRHITGYKMLVYKDFKIFDGLRRPRCHIDTNLATNNGFAYLYAEFPNLPRYGYYQHFGARRGNWTLPKRTLIRYSQSFMYNTRQDVGKRIADIFKMSFENIAKGD